MLLQPHGKGGRLSFFDRIRMRFLSFIDRVMPYRKPIVIAYLVIAAGSAFLLLQHIGKDVLPKVNGGQFQVRLRAPDGTRIERTEEKTLVTLNIIKDIVGPGHVSISSAYISAFNDYARTQLKYGDGRKYFLFAPLNDWNLKHQQPGQQQALQTPLNVMPDLAAAMIQNPKLKVMLNAGFYDLATPYYEGIYEMRQLPIPRKLQANIEYKQYESGHMVYAHEQSLKEIHDAVADFIRRTDNLGG